MANPAAVARAPVKSLPAVRPRAPLELPCAVPLEDGRTELEEGVPELLGGVDVTEETRGEVALELGWAVEPPEPPIGRELAPLICDCSAGVKVPVIPVN